MKPVAVFFVAGLSLAVAGTASAQVIHVDSTDATSIQDAVNMAIASGGPYEIILAAGEYRHTTHGGNQTFPIQFHNATGSFMGTIKGDGPLGGWGQQGATIDAGNGYPIFSAENCDLGIVFENLVLKNGLNEPLTPAGGMYLSDCNGIEINYCSIEQCRAAPLNSVAGGMYIGGGENIFISNCRFKLNESGGGGAMVLDTCTNIGIIDSLFTQNLAVFTPPNTQGSGGAINSTNSDFNVIGCTFDGNGSGRSGGAVSVFTGATFTNLVTFSSSTESKCLFTNNGATLSGGAVHMVGPMVTEIGDCAFSGNHCDSTDPETGATGGGGGGAVWCQGSEQGWFNGTFNGCTFANNVNHLGPGGALAIGGVSDVTILGASALFEFNHGHTHGGAISIVGDPEYGITGPSLLTMHGGQLWNNDVFDTGYGGGLFVGRHAHADVTATRFVDNNTLDQAAVSGAIYCLGWEFADSSCCMKSVDLCGNGSDQSTASCQIRGCNYLMADLPLPSNDPCGLNNPEGCKGNDMASVDCGTPPPGDMDGDDDVDLDDLVAMRDLLGLCKSDVDSDYDTDVMDLLWVIDGWGGVCP